jgi:LEA14-like dessication related protein
VTCLVLVGPEAAGIDGSFLSGGRLSRQASGRAPTRRAHRMSRKRKKTLAALVTIVAVVAVVAITVYITQQDAQRTTLEKVKWSIGEVQVQEALSNSIDVNLRLGISNPNRDPASFDRAAFDLYGNGSKVGSTEYSQKQDLPAFSSQGIIVPMSISWSGDNQALYSAIAGGNMTWELKGTAYFDTYWGTISVPIDVTKP